MEKHSFIHSGYMTDLIDTLIWHLLWMFYRFNLHSVNHFIHSLDKHPQHGSAGRGQRGMKASKWAALLMNYDLWLWFLWLANRKARCFFCWNFMLKCLSFHLSRLSQTVCTCNCVSIRDTKLRFRRTGLSHLCRVWEIHFCVLRFVVATKTLDVLFLCIVC